MQCNTDGVDPLFRRSKSGTDTKCRPSCGARVGLLRQSCVATLSSPELEAPLLRWIGFRKVGVPEGPLLERKPGQASALSQ